MDYVWSCWSPTRKTLISDWFKWHLPESEHSNSYSPVFSEGSRSKYWLNVNLSHFGCTKLSTTCKMSALMFFDRRHHCGGRRQLWRHDLPWAQALPGGAQPHQNSGLPPRRLPRASRGRVLGVWPGQGRGKWPHQRHQGGDGHQMCQGEPRRHCWGQGKRKQEHNLYSFWEGIKNSNSLSFRT